MSSLVSRTQTGAGRRSLRLPNSLNGADWDGSCEVLSEDGERVLCRGWRRGVDGNRRAVLVVLPAAEHPSPSNLDRFAHEFGLKIELDGAWAAQPLELVHDGGRPMLVLEDAGGEPLDQSLGAPMDMGRFLRVAIGIAVRFGPPSRARPHPQGHQAGQHSGEQRDGGGAAHRVRHRIAARSSATAVRASRRPQRHARLYGAGADWTDEPLDRLPQRSLRPRRNPIRSADRSFAIYRHESR